jgi:hypothetical protein
MAAAATTATAESVVIIFFIGFSSLPNAILRARKGKASVEPALPNVRLPTI